jgi:hypothetical protein
MTRKSLAIVGTAALLVLVTAGTVAAGLGTVGAQSPPVDATDDSPANHRIAVSATGTASATPDQAVLRVAVTAEGEDPAAVRDELAEGSEQLRSALDDLGVEYETERFSIREERRRVPEPREGDERATTYRGVHSFEVTVDDTDRTGAAVDAAAEAGAEVNDVRLTLSDERREQVRDDAIRDAMADAEQQATTIAGASDLRVTTVDSVDASGGRFRPVPYAETAAGDGGGGTTIDSGDVSVRYTVQVSYNATSA